ncbi:MAG: serine/threonine-protein phosphatase [Chloroflexi bacterium]|nr:serine/threonine-protein phosphatase [Chloroflexota bacterium]
MAVFQRKKGIKNSKQANEREAEGSDSSRLVIIESHAEVSIGKVRKQNEDTIFAMHTRSLSYELQVSYGLFVVADGMGGHDNGEVASSTAVAAVVKVIQEQLFARIQHSSSLPTTQEVEDALKSAAQSAQEAVLSVVPGGGTTLSAALVINNMLHFAHVGDSRIYLYTPQEGLKTLTKDHTVVRRLVDLGQISADEASSNPLRNQLFRAVGQGEGFKVDLGLRELRDPCTLLLCSDGLWGLLSEETLLKTLEKGQSAQTCTQSLVNAANKAGGSDNISVIIVKIS